MAGAEKGWQEADSADFMDYGDLFVPHRALQWRLITRLLEGLPEGARVIDLCCGDGRLTAQVLSAHPGITMTALDGSPAMLAALQKRLTNAAARLTTGHMALAAAGWRKTYGNIHAIYSSLAVHHLDDAAKQQLFADLFTMLVPGGRLVIADVIQPAGSAALRLAADLWDAAVREEITRCGADAALFDKFQVEGWNIFRFPDPIDMPSLLSDQLRWLADAGYIEVDVHWMYAGHAIFSGRRPGGAIRKPFGVPPFQR